MATYMIDVDKVRTDRSRLLVRGLWLGRARLVVVPLALAYLGTRFMLFFIIYVSALAVRAQGGANGLPPPTHNLLVDGLVRWDSAWYLFIAEHGYSTRYVTAFFPGYPLLIRAIAAVVHRPEVVGIVVSNAALALAVGYIYALTRQEFDSESGLRAALYLCAAPAAVCFSAVYTESLFIALVAATFYHARHSQWARAAIFGVAASATRNTGAVLAAVVILEGLHQQGVRFWPLRLGRAQVVAARGSLVAGLVVPLGLAAYMVYLWRRFGDPLLFVHEQSVWEATNQQGHLGAIANTITHSIGTSLLSGAGLHGGVVVINLLPTLFFSVLCVAVIVRMRPAHGVYAAATFLIPLILGHGIVGMIRYVAMLVPCFMLLGAYGRRPWVDRLTLVFFLPLMGYLAFTFSHNYNPI